MYFFLVIEGDEGKAYADNTEKARGPLFLTDILVNSPYSICCIYVAHQCHRYLLPTVFRIVYTVYLLHTIVTGRHRAVRNRLGLVTGFIFGRVMIWWNKLLLQNTGGTATPPAILNVVFMEFFCCLLGQKFSSADSCSLDVKKRDGVYIYLSLTK